VAPELRECEPKAAAGFLNSAMSVNAGEPGSSPHRWARPGGSR